MNFKKLSRRNFFKATTLSVGGLVTTRFVPAEAEKQSFKKREIVYRTLGKTGIQVPVISCGSIKKDNASLIKAAIEAGIILFDTARGYENGENEKMLGNVLKNYDRAKIIVATKTKVETNRDGMFSESVTAGSFVQSLDLSLKSLQMEYVDILYTHAVKKKEAVVYEPVLKALKTAKEQGKARFVGVTTHSNMAEVIDAAVECGQYDVILTSYNYQYKPGSDVEQAIKRAAEAGLGIVGMKSQAGKFLDKERQKPVNNKAAIKYVLNNPHIHTLLLSIKSYDKLNEFMAIMDNLELTNDELNELESYILQGSLYCLGCGECFGQCRKNLPIPDLMRAYMYTYGYNEVPEGYKLVQSLNVPSKPCEECIDCPVQCRNGFDVAQKVKDIARLKQIPVEFAG